MEILDKVKPGHIVLSLVILVGLLAIALAVTGPHDWGDVPTWLAMVGTLGSFWAALAIYYWNVRETRFAPARLVSAYNVRIETVARTNAPNIWHGRGYNNPLNIPAGKSNVESDKDVGPVVKRLRLAVENRSDHAIHSIRIDLGFPDGSSIRPITGSYATLRPHGKLIPSFHFENDIDISGIRPWVFFTDAAGRRWANKSGTPVRLANKDEGVYDGDGRLDFLTSDVEAHEGLNA
jgi:hypothetical protein